MEVGDQVDSFFAYPTLPQLVEGFPAFANAVSRKAALFTGLVEVRALAFGSIWQQASWLLAWL